MIEELVERKSQRNTCAETDKVTHYGIFETTLLGGPLEFTLQPHKVTKDGQAVIREMYLQYGGCTKWENAHDAVMSTLKTNRNSANANKTLTNHIATYRVNLVDVKRCCKRTGRSPPTVREQILWMVGSIITANPLLTAHIAQINGDPLGLGMNFEGAATHLMLADPIE